MRRVFVICLILLFPLNVFALSLSAATLQWSGAAQRADRPAASPVGASAIADAQAPAGAHAVGIDCLALCDVDPDEPPAGADFQDSVNKDSRAQAPVLSGWANAPAAPARHGLSSAPPTKPPPIA